MCGWFGKDVYQRILRRSHDNSKFASAGGDRSVFLWDVTAGVTTRRIPGHIGKINTVEFNEDATVLASGKLTFYPSQKALADLVCRFIRRDCQTMGSSVRLFASVSQTTT